MEDGLGETYKKGEACSLQVLILVVMEDGLGVQEIHSHRKNRRRLNPCCNGRWSRSREIVELRKIIRSLNPCCNGRWSRRSSSSTNATMRAVLILVVMEDGLGDESNVMETIRTGVS